MISVMQAETLTQLKQQIVSLNKFEKQDLAAFLAEEIKDANDDQVLFSTPDDEKRKSQLEWLKANREKFAGKYIALSGTELVGESETFRGAREQALEKGFQNPFVTFVYSENDVPFGGW